MKRLGNNSTNNGEMQGRIKNTQSQIQLDSVAITLDRHTAWALCNVLNEEHIIDRCGMQIEKHQHQCLINLGKSVAAFIDHPNRDFTNTRAKVIS